MAATVTQKGTARVPGDAQSKIFTISGDAAYPNPAGYVFTPSQFNFQRITKIYEPVNSTVASAAWSPVIIPTYASDGSDVIVSFALHLVVATTSAEVANGVNVSTAVFSFIIEGN